MSHAAPLHDRAWTPAARALLGWVRRIAAGSEFPVFVLGVLAFTTVMTGALLAVPAAPTGVGAFAQDFRVWCLSLGGGGGSAWAPLLGAAAVPLVLAAGVLLVWWEPLREGARHGLRAWRGPLAAAAAVVLSSAAALGGLFGGGGPVALEFPAESLRTSYAAPPFELTDQDDRPVSLSALRGRVVLLTSIYARCPTACPMILAETRRVVDRLSPEQRAGLSVVAITMEPERDTVARLAELARAHGMSAPVYHLATGDPKAVAEILDRLQVSRQRDPETGLIDHASLFTLVDRQGRVAYRFALGDSQEEWLVEAVMKLLSEPMPSA